MDESIGSAQAETSSQSRLQQLRHSVLTWWNAPAEQPRYRLTPSRGWAYLTSASIAMALLLGVPYTVNTLTGPVEIDPEPVTLGDGVLDYEESVEVDGSPLECAQDYESMFLSAYSCDEGMLGMLVFEETGDPELALRRMLWNAQVNFPFVNPFEKPEFEVAQYGDVYALVGYGGRYVGLMKPMLVADEPSYAYLELLPNAPGENSLPFIEGAYRALAQEEMPEELAEWFLDDARTAEYSDEFQVAQVHRIRNVIEGGNLL